MNVNEELGLSIGRTVLREQDLSECLYKREGLSESLFYTWQ